MQKSGARLRSSLCGGSLVVYVLLLLFPLESWGKDAPHCVQLYRQKRLAKAAGCFESLEQRLARAPANAKNRVMRGRSLRNASSLYEKAAKQSQKVDRQAYLRFRAVQSLQKLLANKLYESENQRKELLLKALQLKEAIGYATLTLVSTSGTRLELRGYRFTRQARGTWTLKVRPGTYAITARFPKGKSQKQSLKVVAKKSYILTLKPPTPQVVRRRLPVVRRRVRELPRRRVPLPKPKPNPRRPIGWILLATGGGILLLGGGALGGALLMGQDLSSRNIALRKLPPGATERERQLADLVAGHDLAQALSYGGWIAGGVGAALALVGIIWLGTQPATLPQKPTPASIGKASVGKAFGSGGTPFGLGSCTFLGAP